MGGMGGLAMGGGGGGDPSGTHLTRQNTGGGGAGGFMYPSMGYPAQHGTAHQPMQPMMHIPRGSGAQLGLAGGIQRDLAVRPPSAMRMAGSGPVDDASRAVPASDLD